ncbi:unnamed protein product [Urochloa decumbens]|uniref:Uncharacterized protein n=1 Tax=Urochloa decumbens TaxID=240449 RepID=A0ABC9AK39_9POAL
MKEDSAPRVVCKICVAKGESQSASWTGCPFCLAKAAVLDRIRELGGNIIEIEEEIKTKPLATLKPEYLDKVKAQGGCIMKTVVGKKDGNGNGSPVSLVTVKLPDSYVKGLMSVRPPTHLLPLDEDDMQESELMLAAEAATLYSIERVEKILAQFYEKGYAIADLEVVE